MPQLATAQPAYGHKPGVITWYHVYCVAMALLYVLCIGIGIVLLVFAPDMAEEDPTIDDPIFFQIMGGMFIMISLALVVLFGIAPFLPRKKWVWIYGFVPICLGLTSACTMIACIPLLIFWLKAETKAYFSAN
jgi:hypothetical protein